jgi:hypothetical protein
MAKDTYTFLDLALDVLKNERTPLSSDEIWEKAQATGLLAKLEINGRTPHATLGSRLYVNVKRADSLLMKVGAWPARFILKSNAEQLTGSQLEGFQDSIQEETVEKPKILEKDLHAFLVAFAASNFDVACKTINHSKSIKKGLKVNEWLHPDIVGFRLETDGWAPETVSLFRETDSLPVSLFSFELKQALDFSTLRESYFQAVSNSSWAHQGYLVAAKIKEDPEFQGELERLNSSFGIGVIKLDIAHY